MNSVANPSTDDVGIDLRELLGLLWSRRWLIVVCGLVGATILAVYAFLTAPVYRATTVFVSASDQRTGLSGTLASAMGSFGELASLAGLGGVGSDAVVEESLAVLKSREFTENFIRNNNLMPELYPDLWDAAQRKWKVPPESVPTLARAYKRFDRTIRFVMRDKRSGLVTMNIDWTDRERAAQWANRLVATLNAEMRARAIVQTDASLAYLRKELESTQVVEIREAINRLIEGQIRQRMLANVTQEYAFRVVDKALVPDMTDKLRPKRALMAVLGGVLGVGVAFAWVLGRRYFSRS